MVRARTIRESGSYCSEHNGKQTHLKFHTEMLSREESNMTELIHLRQEEEVEEVGGRRLDADEDEDEDEEPQVVIFSVAAAAGTVDVARRAFGGAAQRNHGRATASH